MWSAALRRVVTVIVPVVAIGWFVATRSTEGVSQFLYAAGTIAKIDLDQSLVTVEAKKGGILRIRTAKAFVVAPQSGISDLGGQPLRLDDMKAGDQVTIAYTVEGDKNVAQAMVLQGWRKVKPKPEEEPVKGLETAPIHEPLSSPSPAR